MYARFRGALVGALAVAAVAVGASTASALTISPAGSYTLSSSNTTYTLTSNGLSLTCRSTVFAFSLPASGSGTIPVGSARYANCTSPVIGNVTITQQGAWTITPLLTALRDGTGNLVGYVIRSIKNVSSPLCTFVVEGIINIGKLIARVLPMTIPGSEVLGVLSDTGLLVTATIGAGCALAGITVGLGATGTGSFVSSSSITFSG